MRCKHSIHVKQAAANTKKVYQMVATLTSMLPTEVWLFQAPMTRPLLPLPYQLAMMLTTEGQPQAWTKPAQQSVCQSLSIW